MQKSFSKNILELMKLRSDLFLDIIKLKGTSEGLILSVNFEYDEESIKSAIREELKKIETFLGNNKEIILEIENNETEGANMDFLETLLKSLGIKIKNIKAKKTDEQQKDSQNSVEDKAIPGTTKLIRRNVRSGQRVEHDGTIVIIGDVNPGSEIIAEGHVIIVGTLKGNVHAGSGGNDEAVVYASKFQPNLIKIGKYIARAPENEKKAIDNPEIALIKEEKIIIENA